MSQHNAKENTEVIATTSSEIAIAFNKLLNQYQQNKSKIATKEEEAEKTKNQDLLARTKDYTVDHIVNEMASLQLSFGNIVQELATELSAESNKLDELKRAIATEQEHLQRLNQVRLVADAIHILKQEHQAKKETLQTNTAKVRETFAQEIAQTKKEWDLEQAEFSARIEEAAELLINKRTLEEADYQYELERQRTIEQDEYESDKRLQTRELAELDEVKNKDWAEREKYLAKNKAEFSKNMEKIASFEEKLKEEYNKAKGKAIKEAEGKYKIEADLQEKEWSATQQGYELKIASLTTVVEQQTEQVAEITAQLQEANTQAQNLAMQAFQNTAK